MDDVESTSEAGCPHPAHPTARRPGLPDGADTLAWERTAVARLVDVWRRRGAAYERHLARQALPADPVDDLFALAARRVLPLEPARHRLLPREGLEPWARAMLRLVRPDREVLVEALNGRVEGDARRDHAAEALGRLVLNARAARRLDDAPLATTASPPGVGGCD